MLSLECGGPAPLWPVSRNRDPGNRGRPKQGGEAGF